jgi:hypothetical protein
MTPSVRDVLQGCIVATSRPTPPEAGPEYAASRGGMVSVLTMLAAQEAEHAARDAISENTAIRALFALVSGYSSDLRRRLEELSRDRDADLSTPALDAANARLRVALIELHEAVEAAGDTAMDARILQLYVRMAEGRRMPMPGG